MNGAVGQIYLGRGDWNIAESSLRPSEERWRGEWFKCRDCGTIRIGRIAMYTGIAAKVHKLFCDQKITPLEQKRREASGEAQALRRKQAAREWRER